MKMLCSYHLGDQLFTLWFLNTAVKRWPNENFSFYVMPQYADEVRRLARKVPNLEVTDKNSGHYMDAWIGQTTAYEMRDRQHFARWMIWFHAYLAEKWGFCAWPVRNPQEMLFPAHCMDGEHAQKDKEFDVLFVNSRPLSFQCPGYDPGRVESIAAELERAGLRVFRTEGAGMKLNQLGEIASRSRFVAGVCNAPFLATFNELAFPKVDAWLGYSSDRLDFDEKRCIWSYSMDEFESNVRRHVIGQTKLSADALKIS